MPFDKHNTFSAKREEQVRMRRGKGPVTRVNDGAKSQGLNIRGRKKKKK